MDFEHAVQAWTVGQLRDALAGLPDDLPIIVDVAEEPGGDTVQEQVVVHAGFGHGSRWPGGAVRWKGFSDRLRVSATRPITATNWQQSLPALTTTDRSSDKP